MSTNLLPIKQLHYQTLDIFLSQEEPPPHVQALVYEQDTALLLQPPFLLTYPTENTRQLLQQAVNTPPQPLGTVVVKAGHPLQIHAVIHDLDCEPSWQPQWIRQALVNILQVAEQHQLYFLAMPLLGTTYGHLHATQFFPLLKEALAQVSTVDLQQIWLIMKEQTLLEELEELYQNMLENTQ